MEFPPLVLAEWVMMLIPSSFTLLSFQNSQFSPNLFIHSEDFDIMYSLSSLVAHEAEEGAVRDR